MNKEIFISEIRNHVSQNAGRTTHPRFKRTKLLGKLSPLGSVLFAVAIAAGVLISSFFTIYYVVMTGELEITGTEAPLFYWDDTIPFVGDTCARPIDITTMTAGQIEAFPHNILNADAGYWRITFDLSDVTFTDPMDPFFGFYFTVSDYAIDGVPTTLENLVVAPGEKASFNYNYEIDHEMVTPDDPLAFNVIATIAPYTETLDAIDDSYAIGTASGTLDVLLNDNTGMFGCDISSINTTGLDPSFTVTISEDKQTLLFTQTPGPWVGQHFHYTIVDKASGLVTDTAEVTVHA